MAAPTFRRWVPAPLALFVDASEDMIWGKLHVQVKSARGTRCERFIVDLAAIDECKLFARCYEAHIRLSHEEKAVEDLLR